MAIVTLAHDAFHVPILNRDVAAFEGTLLPHLPHPMMTLFTPQATHVLVRHAHPCGLLKAHVVSKERNQHRYDPEVHVSVFTFVYSIWCLYPEKIHINLGFSAFKKI
jgi:hypothetical protein